MARRSRADKKPSDVVGLTLRLTEELRSKLEAEAQSNDRSLNSEVIDRLEQSVSAPRELSALVYVMSEIAKRVAGTSGLNWRNDAFRARAFSLAVESFLFGISAQMDVNEGNFELAYKAPEDLRKLYATHPGGEKIIETPDSFAEHIFSSVWDQILHSDDPVTAELFPFFRAAGPGITEARQRVKRDALKPRRYT